MSGETAPKKGILAPEPLVSRNLMTLSWAVLGVLPACGGWVLLILEGIGKSCLHSQEEEG